MCDFSKVVLSPYEYWDLRLRNFEIFRTFPSTPGDNYEEIKDTLYKELDDFLKGQENHGIRATS